MEPRFGAIVRASMYVTVCMMLSCSQWNDDWGKTAKAPKAKVDTPPTLQQLDRKATDVVVTVPTGDWPRVYALVQDINQTWLDYRNQVYGQEAPQVVRAPEGTTSPKNVLVDRIDAAIYVLQYAATAQDPSRTMNTANLISSLTGDLYEYYTPAIPPGIHRLNVLQRQIVLDAADDNLADVAVILDQSREVWRKVRPAVEAKTSVVYASQIEENLAAQQDALDDEDCEILTAKAKKNLELLGEVERLY